MITRDILDYSGATIGTLNFEDGTSEEVIAAKLAEYAAPPVVEIPDVTPRQIRQALLLSGISMSQIEDALASLPDPQKSFAQIEWEFSVAFKRNRPLVAAVGSILGWTSDQLDALWRLAGSLG